MSVEHDPSGRRSTSVEVVVPGTLDEVWRAVATGPGVSAWFVPTAFEPAEGVPAAVAMDFGPGLQVRSPVTRWEPPRRFATQGQGWGGSPPIATEWDVEVLGDGICLVRVVNSLVADSNQWDGHLEATEAGWPDFFRALADHLARDRPPAAG